MISCLDDIRDEYSFIKYVPSVFFAFLLVVFAFSYVPVLLEPPENITPDSETHNLEVSVGDGDHDATGYQSEETDGFDRFISECTADGEYLSTGGRFNCDYQVVTSFLMVPKKK